MDCTHELTIDQEFESLCPPLQPEEERLLEESLIADGPRESIITWANHQDKIVDGYNRYRLCKKNEITFSVKALVFADREEVIQWILRNQLGRRNLSDSQRALLAARLAKCSHGGDHKSDQVANLQLETLAEVAEKCNVSKRSVSSAKTVLTSGDKELIADVQAGKMSVSKAEKVVKAKKPKQEKKRGSMGKMPEGPRASSVMQYAIIATSHMDRILDKDPDFDEAFDKIENYIANRRLANRRKEKIPAAKLAVSKTINQAYGGLTPKFFEQVDKFSCNLIDDIIAFGFNSAEVSHKLPDDHDFSSFLPTIYDRCQKFRDWVAAHRPEQGDNAND